MKPSFTKQAFRKPFHRPNNKPIINYQIKGFSSDSDNKHSLSPQGINPVVSFSTLYSGSEEEKDRNDRKEWYKVKIMFEGMLLKDSEPQEKKQGKFQDAREKSGPNPKRISLPWFV